MKKQKAKTTKKIGASLSTPYSVTNSIDKKVKPLLVAVVLVGLTCLIL
jgi:hypothetical protein